MFGESITKININFLAIVIVVSVLMKWFTGDVEGGVQIAAAIGPIFTALTVAYTYGATKKKEFNSGNGPSIKKDMSKTNHKR
jgi:membrane associated rhomboid family serine protease